MKPIDPTRRDFMKITALSAATLLLSPPLEAQTATPRRIKLGVFSKHLQWLDYNATADAVAEVGWDGIECPVRPGGHVLPDRVKDDLPAMNQALQNRGLKILMAATNIKDATEPFAQDILETLQKLRIPLYRIGGWKYDERLSVPAQLQEVKKQLVTLEKANQKLGLCAAFQNHSGTGVGAPLWDVYHIIHDMDPRAIGFAFDIGHATVEGGYAWPIHFKMALPFTKIVIVKDFVWRKNDRGQWRVQWVPLGEGMVDRKFFTLLKDANYSGAIIQHFEYETEGATEPERRVNLLKAMKKDCATLQRILQEEGLL